MNIEPKKYKGSINLYKDSFIELSEFIKVKLNYEKRANQSNFDSGIPIEDYIRNEIKKLLPPKYAVTSGTIVDKDHNTCGDCDIIIFDNFSSPLIKNPSTYDSRRKIIPYESVYGIIEIKQRYNTGVLDKNGNLKDDADTNIITACEKIAMFKKLSRNQIFNRVDLPGFAINESKVLNRPFGYILCLDGPEDFKIVQKEIRRISETYQEINELMDYSFWINTHLLGCILKILNPKLNYLLKRILKMRMETQ